MIRYLENGLKPTRVTERNQEKNEMKVIKLSTRFIGVDLAQGFSTLNRHAWSFSIASANTYPRPQWVLFLLPLVGQLRHVITGRPTQVHFNG